MNEIIAHQTMAFFSVGSGGKMGEKVYVKGNKTPSKIVVELGFHFTTAFQDKIKQGE